MTKIRNSKLYIVKEEVQTKFSELTADVELLVLNLRFEIYLYFGIFYLGFY